MIASLDGQDEVSGCHLLVRASLLYLIAERVLGRGYVTILFFVVLYLLDTPARITYPQIQVSKSVGVDQG